MRQLVKTTLVSLTALAFLAAGADAHSRAYQSGTSDILLNFCLSTDDGTDSDWNGVPSSGGSCYSAGHIVPDAITGESSITVTDLVTPAIGVYACQDVDLDQLCGEDATLPDAGNDILEFGATGCGSIPLLDTAFGGTWVSGSGIVVYPDGPIFGALASYCLGEIAPGTTGTITHA